MKKIISLILTGINICVTQSLLAQNIGHTTITFNDPTRTGGYGSGGGPGRQIQTEIYYPAATNGDNVPCNTTNNPVLVFGHGFQMAWSAYQNIWEHMVQAGYVIAFPRTEGGLTPSHLDFGKDLAIVCQKMLNLNNDINSLFYNKLNGKSAIMGHSMGGGSSFLAVQNNTNVTIMVTFAPANTNPSSQAAAKLINVPSLVIAGENDCVTKPAVHQKPMYDSLASNTKGYLVIKGGGHCYFANFNFQCSFGESTCSPSPTITRAEQQSINQFYTQKWLDYFLKDSCSAWKEFIDSATTSSKIIYQSNFNFNNPIITQNGNNLTSTPATTYQWYKDNVLMPGETSQTLTTTAPGDYYVEVTYVNGCKYKSNTITVLAHGIVSYFNQNNILIAPNLVTNRLTISLSDLLKNEEIRAEIIDINGRIVAGPIIINNSTSSINTENLSPGLYALKLSSNGLVVSKLFSKQ